MSKLTAVILTAAICLPLGALLQGSASADRRKNSLPSDVAARYQRVFDGPFGVAGHRQLSRAQIALHEALDAMDASRRDSEGIWSDTSGRASAIQDAIERAVQAIDLTAAWVNGGTNANDARSR